MKVTSTFIEDLLIFEPILFDDPRGYFFESFNEKTIKSVVKSYLPFMQDNEAFSIKNVIRGLHYQNYLVPQAKLVRVLQGKIWDVAVDLRKNSKTYKESFGVELSSENKLQFYIPRGFAHGYSVLSDAAVVFYKVDNLYNPDAQEGIIYNDPELNIEWKVNNGDAIVSIKDRQYPNFDSRVNCF